MIKYEITHFTAETAAFDEKPTTSELSEIVASIRGYAGGNTVATYDTYNDAYNAVEHFNTGYNTIQTQTGTRGWLEWCEIDAVEYDSDGDITDITTYDIYYCNEHHNPPIL